MSYAQQARAQASAVSALIRKATGMRPNPHNRSAHPRIEVRAGSPGALIAVHGETETATAISDALRAAGYLSECDRSHGEDEPYVTIRVTGRAAIAARPKTPTKTQNAQRLAREARVSVRRAHRDGATGTKITYLYLQETAQRIGMYDADGWTIRKAARLTIAEMQLRNETHLIDFTDAPRRIR